MELTKITGYVGRESVTAFVYPNSDYGLSHYTYQDKNYMGTVRFTHIDKSELISY